MCESKIYRYASEDFMQGETIRLDMSDTVAEAMEVVKSKLGTDFELVEVCQDAATKCVRFLRNFRELMAKGEGTLQELKKEYPDGLTHQSTWMLLRQDNPELSFIKKVTGE